MTLTRGRPRQPRPREEDPQGFTERVVYTRRIAKVVKGGRRLRFNALVVVGDGAGQVGAGMGKAIVIPDAVRKGNAIARRGMVTIPIKGSTIPHEITVKKGASIVVIKPAREGTGIIAAGAMRAMLELGGVRDVVGKSLGSRNPINIVKATLEALRLLRDPDVETQRRLGGNPQEAPQQSVKTPVAAAPQRSVQAPVAAAPQQSVQAPVAAAPQQSVQEPVAEAPQQSVQEPVAEAPQQSVQEPVAEAEKEPDLSGQEDS